MSKPGQSEQTLQRAALALQMGQLQEAEQLASGVLKSDRGNASAAIVLGQVLLATGRAAEAIAPLERVARRNKSPAVETLLAAALNAVGRTDEAMSQLKRAITRRPPFIAAFIEYCNRLGEAHKVDEAMAVAEAGLALAPSSIDLQLAMARLLNLRNDRVRSRAFLLQAERAAPGRPDVLSELARVLLLDGDYAAAAEAYRRVLSLAPHDLMKRADLAVCLFELGNRADASAQLREAVRAEPRMVPAAIKTMAASSRGRFFLRPSTAFNFLRGETKA